eukprot:TRINITY_DN12679_c1_g3_i1.p1 TRINITY_DN12679_c1_g3~~TRINITY_DN12679_c1_g3_i1.p1  ORF type:complete len:256 (+),score=112.60 TRINITY_DN12679_c1_g3_i1:38-769(+)
MAVKKKEDGVVAVDENRPKSQSDSELERAQEEVKSVEGKLAEIIKRVEENTAKAAKIKKLEEQLVPLEENRKKVTSRFKRVLSERPESAGSNHTPAPIISGSKDYKDLVATTSETVMRILSATFKQPPEPPDDFKCPLGLSQDIFFKVLELRQQRITRDEEIDAIKETITPLREEVLKGKQDGVGKALIKRTEKVLQARREEEKEAQKKVDKEDEEWNKAKEEEEWQKQLRAQVEDSSKKKAK